MKRPAEQDIHSKRPKPAENFHLAVRCGSRIRLFDRNRQETTFDSGCVAGSSISVGEGHEIHVEDYHNREIHVMHGDGSRIDMMYCFGIPHSVYCDRVGSRLIVALQNPDHVVAPGKPTSHLYALKCLPHPEIAIADKKGRIIVANKQTIQSLNEDDPLDSAVFPTAHLRDITGMGVDDDNRLVVCDYENQVVCVFSEERQLEKTFYLNFRPQGLAIDPETGRLYLSDIKHNRVVILNENTGEELSSFHVQEPAGLAFGPPRPWRVWDPSTDPESMPTKNIIKAWCHSKQRGEGPLAMLPRDVAIHEIAQFSFNQ